MHPPTPPLEPSDSCVGVLGITLNVHTAKGTNPMKLALIASAGAMLCGCVSTTPHERGDARFEEGLYGTGGFFTSLVFGRDLYLFLPQVAACKSGSYRFTIEDAPGSRMRFEVAVITPTPHRLDVFQRPPAAVVPILDSGTGIRVRVLDRHGATLLDRGGTLEGGELDSGWARSETEFVVTYWRRDIDLLAFRSGERYEVEIEVTAPRPSEDATALRVQFHRENWY